MDDEIRGCSPGRNRELLNQRLFSRTTRGSVWESALFTDNLPSKTLEFCDSSKSAQKQFVGEQHQNNAFATNSHKKTGRLSTRGRFMRDFPRPSLT